ncbi:MAG: hypothetical protein ACTSUR_06845 [Candidatus Heimdallarchaeaceae archaeon]
MSSTDLVQSTVLRQRKRYEALGNAIKKAEGLQGWIKALFYTTLFFGLPTILLLSDKLKDSITTNLQRIIFGFRILLVALALYLASKMTPEMFTAQNDFNKKLEEVGYKNSETNTPEEMKFVYRDLIYRFLKTLMIITSFLAVFLISNRDNYGFIIGQQIIYLVIVLGLVMTAKFWNSDGPDYSPRMGGRLIVFTFLPVLVFTALEIIIDFFGTLAKPRFHYNSLQITWGFLYPFIFLAVLIAVLYTTKKTIREKQLIQNARMTEFRRMEKIIHEKGFFKRIFFSFKRSWDKVFHKTDYSKVQEEKNIDKKPNETVIKTIWTTLFLTVTPFAIILPWNLFPHDGMVILACLMIAYQYSMVRYHRYKVDVFFEPEKDESINPPQIRTLDAINITYRLVTLPLFVFILAQFIMSGVITKGVFTLDDELVVIGFTWVAVLMLIPISIQMFHLLKTNTDINRSKANLLMHRNTLITFLIIEVFLLVASLIGRILAHSIDYTYILPIAIYMQATIVGVTLILPLLYHLIAPRLKEQNYKGFKIGTYIFVGLVDAGILVWFIFDIVVGYFA